MTYPVPQVLSRRLRWWVELNLQDPRAKLVGDLIEWVERGNSKTPDACWEVSAERVGFPELWMGASLGPLLEEAGVGFSVDSERIIVTKANKGRCRRPYNNLVGKTFGLWAVVAYGGYRKRYGHAWKVRCACGSTDTLILNFLNHSGSCGCNPCYASPKQLVRDAIRKLRKDNPAYYLLELVKKQADVRDGRVPCTIQTKDIHIPTTCPVRRVPLELHKHGTPDSPVVVRLDPLKGFVPGNIIVTSWEAAKALREALKPEEPLPDEPEVILFGDMSWVSLDNYEPVLEPEESQQLRYPWDPKKGPPSADLVLGLIQQGVRKRIDMEKALGLPVEHRHLMYNLLNSGREAGRIRYDTHRREWFKAGRRRSP